MNGTATSDPLVADSLEEEGWRWWPGWKGEAAVAALLVAMILFTFSAIAVGGRSFSAAWSTAGVFGLEPSGGHGVDVSQDPYRLDRGASSWAFEPWAEVNSRTLAEGDIPLWNRYQGIGMPQAANAQSAVFDPFMAAVNLHPTPLMWDATFLLGLIVGALTMYTFLRRRDIGRAGSLAGAMTFSLSGYFLLYSNNHFFRAYLYLPVLFLLADAVARSRRRWPPVALGAAVAGELLVGMPEAAVCVLGALTVYSACAILWPPPDRQRHILAARFAGAAVLGVLFAAPLLLPLAEYVPLSHSLHEDGTTGLVYDPVRLLLNWLVPRLIGPPLDSLQGTGWSGTRNWIGGGAALAALFALASRTTWRRSGAWVFVLLAAGFLAKAYGLPVVNSAGHLVALSATNFPVFGLPVAGFALAALVGVGTEAIGARTIRPLLLAALLLGGAAVILKLYRLDAPFLADAPEGHLRKEFGRAALALTVVGIGAAVALRRRLVGQGLVLAAIAMELLTLAPRHVYNERADPYVRPSWVQFLQRNAGQDRMYATNGMLFPNTATAFGLQDVRTLDALYPERFARYLKTFIQPTFVDRFVGGPWGQLAEQTPVELYDNPMFDLLSVRYLVTPGGAPGDRNLDQLVAPPEPSDHVRKGEIELSGDRRWVVLLDPGAHADLSAEPTHRHVSFSAALEPPVTVDPTFHGLDLVVSAQTSSGAMAVASRTFPPRSPGAPARWEDIAAPLPSGTTMVSFQVTSRDGAPHALGVSNIRLAERPPRRDPGPQYRRVHSERGAAVFENVDRLQRVQLVHEIIPAANEADAMRILQSKSRQLPSGAWLVSSFDPQRQAVVEGASPLPGANRCGAKPRDARIVRLDSNEVDIEVEPGCAGMLVLSDLYFPGWRATVNNRPAPVRAANLALRSVFVPEGRASVRFTYAPISFRAGAGAAAVGGAGAALYLFLPRRGWRRTAMRGLRERSPQLRRRRRTS